jgi:hypothetical protein
MHSPLTERRGCILWSLSLFSFNAGHFPPTSQICSGFEALFRSHFGGSERSLENNSIFVECWRVIYFVGGIVTTQYLGHSFPLNLKLLYAGNKYTCAGF